MTDPDGLGPPRPVDPGLAVLQRIGVIGLGAAVVLSLAVGIIGGSGRGGLGVFLLVCALTAGITGLVGVALGLRDEARGQPASRARLVWTISAFGGVTLLLAMVVGVLS